MSRDQLLVREKLQGERGISITILSDNTHHHHHYSDLKHDDLRCPLDCRDLENTIQSDNNTADSKRILQRVMREYLSEAAGLMR